MIVKKKADCKENSRLSQINYFQINFIIINPSHGLNEVYFVLLYARYARILGSYFKRKSLRISEGRKDKIAAPANFII